MTNWSTEISELESGRVLKYSVRDENQYKLSYRRFIVGLRYDSNFRSFINQTLAQCPMQGFRFETPPVSSVTYDQEFEFVLLAADSLTGPADPLSFQEHFRSDRSVVVFPNLSGDSTMIVPCPEGNDEWYGHLGCFVRNVKHEQAEEVWRTTGEEISTRIGEKPLWLNTHGGGVAWLHIRIDDRPKYYSYMPYKIDLG